MTSFGYWAGRVPPGQFLCCLCFEGFPLDEAWSDDQGQRWDVCVRCHAADAPASTEPERG